MIKIFLIYFYILLLKKISIYYSNIIYLDEFKDYKKNNFTTEMNLSKQNIIFLDSNIYCLNNVNDTKINPLIYFEIINI